MASDESEAGQADRGRVRETGEFDNGFFPRTVGAASGIQSESVVWVPQARRELRPLTAR